VSLSVQIKIGSGGEETERKMPMKKMEKREYEEKTHFYHIHLF
jgi:hypothetical protein